MHGTKVLQKLGCATYRRHFRVWKNDSCEAIRITIRSSVFLIESEEENIFTNIQKRDRGTAGRTEKELHTEAKAKWLYGQWLTQETQRLRLPVLEVRPWDSLSDRILDTNFS